jgi:hypothetical protein
MNKVTTRNKKDQHIKYDVIYVWTFYCWIEMTFEGDLPAGAVINVRKYFSRISAVTNAIVTASLNQVGLASFTNCMSASITSKVLDIRIID